MNKIKGFIVGLLITAATIGAFAWVATTYRGSLGFNTKATAEESILQFTYNGETYDAELDLGNVPAKIVQSDDGVNMKTKDNKAISSYPETTFKLKPINASTIYASLDCDEDSMNKALKVTIGFGAYHVTLQPGDKNVEIPGVNLSNEQSGYIKVWYDGNLCTNSDYASSEGTHATIKFTAQ